MCAQKIEGLIAKFRVMFGSLALFLLGIGVMALPIPSHAQGLTLVTCVGTHAATWTPGLTNTVQTVTLSTQSLWSCPLPGTSASSEQYVSQQLSCETLLKSGSLKWVIDWAGGETTTAQLNAVANVVDGNVVVTLTGSVVEGLYLGDNVAITVTDTNLGATLESACTSPGGLTNASGPSVLTITGVSL